jgi:malonyl-CoA O-methyltransferase
MSTERPPTIDPQAAQRWSLQVPAESPWLHEEVARRMEERLDLIVRTPQDWLHWSPLQGGRQIHKTLQQRYPKAQAWVREDTEAQLSQARAQLQAAWWEPARWRGASLQFARETQAGAMQMLWANMALHMAADPQALIQRWHAALAVDGFLMFSCLGPDTLRELRPVYARMGWPEPSHAFTDMHDWGDMLVHAGFAEPIMDMEHITLSYSSADTLLAELRGLGRNLHPQRFPALRGRHWRKTLCESLERELRGTDGRLHLSFEVVYGHAFKPQPKLTVTSETRVTLEEMRRSLRQIKS